MTVGTGSARRKILCILLAWKCLLVMEGAKVVSEGTRSIRSEGEDPRAL